MPELRKDPVVERWVIIATERARRPMDFAPEVVPPRGPEGCPFCPGHEERTPPELFRSGGSEDGPWSVRVVPNKFPALQTDGEVHAAGEGIFDRIDGVGAHEVVIESPDHFASLGTLPAAHVGEILAAYRERLLALRKDPRLEYVLIFKNHGVAAGASLEHPHSQLIATPILPELVAEELEGAARYFRMKERCVWCDVVRQERRDGSRLVLEEEGFVAVAPFAPRFPFETWILPTAHRASFESLQTDEADALARLLRDLIARLGRLFDDPPYNFALHPAPLKESDPEHFHWHLELMPKLTRLAGFELGTGFFINPTPPEDAARFLRQAGPPAAAPPG
jgi:UDPglucose--hexose-1-phosphate uridylyltransferase